MSVLQDALASPEGTQLPSEAWRSDFQVSTEAEPLYPWFFTAIGLERVPPPEAKSPSKRGGRDRGRGAGRAAGRVRRSDGGPRSAALAAASSLRASPCRLRSRMLTVCFVFSTVGCRKGHH